MDQVLTVGSSVLWCESLRFTLFIFQVWSVLLSETGMAPSSPFHSSNISLKKKLQQQQTTNCNLIKQLDPSCQNESPSWWSWQKHGATSVRRPLKPSEETRGKMHGKKHAAEKMHTVAMVTTALSELDDICTQEEQWTARKAGSCSAARQLWQDSSWTSYGAAWPQDWKVQITISHHIYQCTCLKNVSCSYFPNTFKYELGNYAIRLTTCI